MPKRIDTKRTLIAAMALLASVSFADAACVKFRDMGGYCVAHNGCFEPVYVRWFDQGYCSSGCGAQLGAGRSQTVTCPRGRYRWTEK
jgi:hypothetical protein